MVVDEEVYTMMGSPLLVTMGMVVDEEVDKEVYTMMDSRCSCAFCKRSFPANWRRPACNNDVAVLAQKKQPFILSSGTQKISPKQIKNQVKSKIKRGANTKLSSGSGCKFAKIV